MKSNNYYEGEKRKFNAIDIMLILIAVLVTLMIIFRSQLISFFSGTATKTDCEIYFTCESISNELSSEITDGANITWLESKAHLGRFSFTTAIEPTKTIEKSGDNLVVLRSDTTSSFSGVIAGSAISNNGCYIDGADFLAAGMTITMTTGTVQFTALITDVVFLEK